MIQEKHPGEAPYGISCAPEGPQRIYFIGLGDSRKPAMESFRRAGASVVRRLRRFEVPRIDLVLPELPGLAEGELKRCIQAFVEGALLRNDAYQEFTKSRQPPIQALQLWEPDRNRLALVEHGVHLGRLFGGGHQPVPGHRRH